MQKGLREDRKICAVLDHVIEMCYANQYRIMKDTAIAVEENEVEK